MIYFLFLLSTFTWAFGQLLAFQWGNLHTSIYLLDITIGITAILLMLIPKYRKWVFLDPLFKPLCIFLLFASISLAVNLWRLSSDDILISLLYLLRVFVYPAIYFAVKLIPALRSKTPLMLAFGIFCILGILQYVIMPDMRFLKLIGFDDHYFRLIGTFFDPNFTGAILAGAALYAVALSAWVPATPMVIMLALTFSRASYLCFALGLIYIFVKQKKIALLGVLLLLAVAIVLIPKPFGEGVNLARTFSIFSRMDSWKSGAVLFLEKPLLGWGYNTLRSINGERFQIDNSFIYIAATTGISGLISFVYLLYRGLQSTKRLPEKIFLFTLIFHSLFNNSLFYIWIFFSFWVILGIGTKEYKEL